MEARKADVAGTRNRKATKMALARLKIAGDFLKKNLYSAFYEELHKALLGFISDKLNIGAENLNKENIVARLLESNVPQELADEFASLLDSCEFARYSPDGGNEAMNTHYNEAVKVISSIDSIMKNSKKGASSATAALVIAVLLAIPSVSEAADTSSLDSLWTKGVEAYTSGNWNESVELWKELESVGVVSPELYYNLGNAYYKSGDYAHAILYFERTLKINPSNSDARYNLEFTNSMIQDKIDAVPEFVLKSWARKLSYLMSPDSWAWLSIALLALTLTLVLLFLLGGTTAFRRCGFYGAIVALLLSLGTYSLALWQRNSCLKADYAVVMIPVSSVKSSPSSESSKDLFILHEGTKVQILDSVGQWKNISLSDGRQGWIKDNDIQMI